MSPDSAYRTPAPAEKLEYGQSSYVWPGTQPAPQATDNATRERIVLYGPHGEALIREVPRRVGFREPQR